MSIEALPLPERERIWDDWHQHAVWAPECVSIRNKAGVVVPLKLTRLQAKISAEIERQRAANKPVRVIVLKYRQGHSSAGVASHCFRETAFVGGRTAVVYAHDDKSSKEIRSYYAQYQASYKAFRGVIAQPAVAVDNDDEMAWANDSRVIFRTAGNTKSGRSFRANWLHLSEFAFYPDAEELLTGLMQTMPATPGTCAVIESTANGRGGPFYSRCQKAMRGTVDWAFVFGAWWEHEEYAMAPPNRAAFQARLTRGERELMQRFSLTLDQMYWRSWKIENDLNGSEEKFRQEFPCTPDEAFITSGRPVFSSAWIDTHTPIENPLTGGLRVVDIGTQTRVQVVARERGEARIWKQPVEGHRYVIGLDTAHGIDPSLKASGTSDPDFSAAQVIDIDTGEQAAVLHARLTPSAFAENVVALGRLYKWAFLVPDADPIGQATIQAILALKYPAEHIYVRRRDPSDRRPPVLEEIGFRTTEVTKPQAIQRLENALRQGSIFLFDSRTIDELRSFVWTAAGKMEAQQGSHDDLVMALAVALVGMEQAAMSRPKRDVEFPNLIPARYGRGRTT